MLEKDFNKTLSIFVHEDIRINESLSDYKKEEIKEVKIPSFSFDKLVNPIIESIRIGVKTLSRPPTVDNQLSIVNPRMMASFVAMRGFILT